MATIGGCVLRGHEKNPMESRHIAAVWKKNIFKDTP